MNSLKDKIREMEKEEIVNALKASNWVMARAARILGITERMIGYKIKKLGKKDIRARNISNGKERTELRHSIQSPGPKRQPAK